MRYQSYILGLLGLLLCSANVHAQSSAGEWHWVFFVSKTTPPTAENIALSPEAIAKRRQHGIALDKRDVPVHPAYVQQLEANGCDCRPPLRWLNATLCRTPRPDAIAKLPFVTHLERPRMLAKVTERVSSMPQPRSRPISTQPWWVQELQLPNLLGDGYGWGGGVKIAVFDDGFRGMDTISYFDVMRDQIELTRSFVPDTHDNVFKIGGHGTAVTSLMAGSDYPDTHVLLESQFYLARTENMFRESVQEEYNWAAAAEWVDSIGVDIIQSSVGYNIFTSGAAPNHTYSELDGNTAIITRAADIAAAKGILVINSAGNEGLTNWEHVLFPADGDSVLAVGATLPGGELAGYSSRGPTADGRTKPDVVAPGEGVDIVTGYGVRREGGGTSYASPIIAVMAAWLMAQQPEASNMDVLNAIVRSADRYDTPNHRYGHGMPDAQHALAILAYDMHQKTAEEPEPRLFPNPVTEHLMLFLPERYSGREFELKLVDTKGAVVLRETLAPDSSAGYFRFFVRDWSLSGLQSVLHAQLYDTDTDDVILRQKLVIILD